LAPGAEPFLFRGRRTMTQQIDKPQAAAATGSLAAQHGRLRRYARSSESYERAQRSLAGGVSSNFRLGGDPVPLFFERGEGAHLFDVDGNDYIDFVLGMGPGIIGHAHPAVVAAVRDEVGRGQLFAGQTRGEVELAERFQSAVPCAERVRFGSSGTEMVQAALRIARAATGRDLIAKFEGHYHGWLDPVLTSVAPPLELAGPEATPTPYLPSEGQVANSVENLRILPWNNADAVRALLTGPDGDRIAGLIMEPILCNTSVIPPEPGFVEVVRELTRANDTVLIFDEVITGFRVGLGGAQGRLGVTPDLAVFAKAMASGFPIAALAGSQALMELTRKAVLHGGTYNANVSSVAAANATLRVLMDASDDPYARMERLGAQLIDGLRDAASQTGAGLAVQGLGPVFNTTFGTGRVRNYREYARTDLAAQRRFLIALQDRGVRVTGRGTWFLSAVHSEADIEATITAATDALATDAA
jgi:glutamate-1-semialdehyde 2,1-aminomutase